MSAPANRPLRHRCPHCDALAFARTTRRVNETVSVMYLRCTDTECGFTYVVQLAVTHCLVESGKPNPRLRIPFRPAPRIPTPANDDAPDLDVAARC